MKRRPRLRKTMKWSGTVLTVMLVVVWVGSGWWDCEYTCNRRFTVRLYSGQFLVAVRQYELPDSVPLHDWSIESQDFRLYMGFKFGWNPGMAHWASLALWSMLIPIGLSTILLWYRDRRRAPGLCSKCGYNLRGLAHDLCPECGVAVRFAKPQQHPTKPDIID